MTVKYSCYEWDSDKDQVNLQKHGISFKEAVLIFEDPNAMEFFDKEHSTLGEERYISFGDIGHCLICAVVYTDRFGNTRIISARKATPKEEEIYYAAFRKKN